MPPKLKLVKGFGWDHIFRLNFLFYKVIHAVLLYNTVNDRKKR
jgi:hypothetical protein